MKKQRQMGLLSAFCLLLATSALVPAQTRERTTPKVNPAEREVREIIQNWAKAVKDRDTDLLDKIFADDLFITDDSGATRHKTEEMEILKPSPTMKTISVTNENMVIKTFPRSNTALVTAIVRMVFSTNGRESPFAMRYTSFWEKRQGRWQLTVLHSTRLNSR